MKVAAIIPAGGKGRRMGQGKAKQYLLLGGLPLLVHTLRPFQECSVIDEIVLVSPPDDVVRMQEEIVEPFVLSKVRRIVAGGRERQDSVGNGLAALTEDCELVVIHDAARPLVTPSLIAEAVRVALREGVVTVGVPVGDTIKECDGQGRVVGTLPRERLWITQTPQVFRREIIMNAHRQARKDNFYGTDDAALVERMGIPVRMLAGTPENIKVTTTSDLTWAEHVLARRKSNCQGNKRPFVFASE